MTNTNNTKSLPLLGPEEENALILKYQDTGCKKSLEKLIAHHMGLVKSVANHIHSGVEFEDRVMEGVIGLIDAIKRFQPKRAKFGTFAYFWIKQKIVRQADYEGSTIRISSDTSYRTQKHMRAVKQQEKALCRKLTIQEKQQIEGYRYMQYLPDYVSLSHTPKGVIGHTIEDVITDNTAIDFQTEVETRLFLETRRERLERVLKTMSTRERVVLKTYYGLDKDCTDLPAHGDKGATLEKCAEALGKYKGERVYSREMIRQIMYRATKRLKQRLIADGIRSGFEWTA